MQNYAHRDDVEEIKESRRKKDRKKRSKRPPQSELSKGERSAAVDQQLFESMLD